MSTSVRTRAQDHRCRRVHRALPKEVREPHSEDIRTRGSARSIVSANGSRLTAPGVFSQPVEVRLIAYAPAPRPPLCLDQRTLGQRAAAARPVDGTRLALAVDPAVIGDDAVREPPEQTLRDPGRWFVGDVRHAGLRIGLGARPAGAHDDQLGRDRAGRRWGEAPPSARPDQPAHATDGRYAGCSSSRRVQPTAIAGVWEGPEGGPLRRARRPSVRMNAPVREVVVPIS